MSEAQAGSADAFAELQSLYSRRLYRSIVGITKNREDAEDAMQDTFMRAYRSLGTFEGRSTVYSWLTRIAINSALMVLRRRRTHPEVPFDSPSQAEDSTSQFELRDPRLNPEQVYDQHQRCARIHGAVQKLHSSLRGPLHSRMSHGNSIDEIAQSMEISKSAVKSRLFRARALPCDPRSRRTRRQARCCLHKDGHREHRSTSVPSWCCRCPAPAPEWACHRRAAPPSRVRLTNPRREIEGKKKNRFTLRRAALESTNPNAQVIFSDEGHRDFRSRTHQNDN